MREGEKIIERKRESRGRKKLSEKERGRLTGGEKKRERDREREREREGGREGE